MKYHYCEETAALLPVGPDSTLICYDCSKSTQELREISHTHMMKMVEADLPDLTGMLLTIDPRRGLTDPKADHIECIEKFAKDNGLDPENTDHQDRAIEFDTGLAMLAQGSHKPDEQEDTVGLCAGWQAAHDTLIKRCREQTNISGGSLSELFRFCEDEGIKFQEGATK